ncbi:MAG TPA: ABC transporter ATP-binding protein [Bacteroidales bacterium]|jgi:putative ABC transport system ATP-binding protein|nr:ABC transporter ATP-binding protein [Bacteroidales bacterium]HOJ24857.1 ABC transporter ATP-binding protein [Bacteroidales bacterium]HON98278.1 ABC transporter ATP-binding protein [Bacteroidales bacterium]HOV54696.1 ABC transporter ATP-binding protein [Bacteroidales bacterium]HPB19842.1 ABC transporter ATP-binding protein [Bacteroidales bacterium]
MNSIISLNNIQKTYFIGQVVVNALQGINLKINKNEFVVIMGASGSGKTTLMNIIGCLDTPTSGEYYLNNQLVSGLSDDELAGIRNKEVGFVFQTFYLLPRYNALENVMLPLIYAGVNKNERMARAEAMLELVGLKDRMHHKPNEMSGGQRQRVAIARALINNPSIILADEPTGNLDSRSSYEIMLLLEKLHNEGNTIVLVTHEPDIALFGHRIVKLRDGKIISDEINHKVSLAENFLKNYQDI